MTNFEKYLESINEGKIVIKRRYTDKYPENPYVKETDNAVLSLICFQPTWVPAPPPADSQVLSPLKKLLDELKRKDPDFYL